MFSIVKGSIKLFLAVVFANWLTLEADTMLPGTRDAAIDMVQSINLPSSEEIFKNGVPNFAELGSKLDTILADFQNDVQPKAQMALAKVKLKELSTNPDSIFNNQGLFEALDSTSTQWEKF